MAANVMIVDDNAPIRESVEILFQCAGKDIITAASGEECLHHLAGGFKGVILMDIMMPDMDGWDTISLIVSRGYYKGNVIVMLTGKDVPDCKMEGLQEYVTDYMTKPFNPDELRDAINYYTSLLDPGDTDHD